MLLAGPPRYSACPRRTSTAASPPSAASSSPTTSPPPTRAPSQPCASAPQSGPIRAGDAREWAPVPGANSAAVRHVGRRARCMPARTVNRGDSQDQRPGRQGERGGEAQHLQAGAVLPHRTSRPDGIAVSHHVIARQGDPRLDRCLSSIQQIPDTGAGRRSWRQTEQTSSLSTQPLN
jgi:hypothetical protein